MNIAAQRAATSFATTLIDQVGLCALGREERPEVLEAIATALQEQAAQLRAAHLGYTITEDDDGFWLREHETKELCGPYASREEAIADRRDDWPVPDSEATYATWLAGQSRSPGVED